MPCESRFRWYVLYVRSRHEKSVKAQLDARQEVTLLPLYSARHKWADRLKTVSLPLFPGYVFCRFDVDHRSTILATSGVIDVVRMGADPVPLPDSEIEAIQRVVTSPLLTEPYAGLVQGQKVIMSGGPLTGIAGKLIEIKKNLRLVVSVELLNRSILVEIERDWVVPCEQAKRACQSILAGTFRVA